MLKTKRKNTEVDAGSPKKKKVQFTESKDDHKEDKSNGTSKFNKKPKKDFKNNKHDPKSKTVNKENKAGFKTKGNFTQNKGKFGKAPNAKGKPNFAKDKFSKPQEQGEKPVWSEMKKEKKNLRLIRRKAKATAEIFEISHKAKLLSAQIQRKVVKQEFRMKACKELHCMLKGQYKSIALTHDLSRVIQVLLKHSPEDIKNEITEELLDIMVQMMQSKYAQHAVKRIMKYGTDFIRHEVIKKLFGHIVSLATHTISAPVLDFAYGEFATKKEKLHMQQEFYGDLYKNSKDDKIKTLSDAYKDTPEMKVAILQACKANIQKILDKNLHDSELFQTVLYNYVCECTAEDKAELISTLSPLIVPLSNSLPGVNVASICVWQGTNKDKKTIMKVVKEHVVSLSKHKTAYRLLITIFDAVDDTVLVKKAIVSTLASNLKDVAKDHWGKMVLHWLVKPKDPQAFHPSFIKFLEDGAKSGTSKKDADLRVSELREAILPVLKQDMESDADFWLSSKANFLLTIAVLSIETSKEILESLAKVICQSNWVINLDGKEVLAIEDAGIHMCLKKLAALDKEKTEGTLGDSMCEHLNDEAFNVWILTNRGCFFLLKLIENNEENIANKLIKKIKMHSSLIKQQTSEGAKLLLQKVQKK
ncbi:Protein penguin [Papilio xuthus]|uniref:Protein penguin n=1 Tax=Papilio xuthus TaxID=66420 RepID=A0A194QAR9_PAPXU|nr:Protein penguin [Papilio xuthus]